MKKAHDAKARAVADIAMQDMRTMFFFFTLISVSVIRAAAVVVYDDFGHVGYIYGG